MSRWRRLAMWSSKLSVVLLLVSAAGAGRPGEAVRAGLARTGLVRPCRRCDHAARGLHLLPAPTAGAQQSAQHDAPSAEGGSAPQIFTSIARERAWDAGYRLAQSSSGPRFARGPPCS